MFLFCRGVNIRNIRSLNINNTYRSANCNVKIRKKPNQLLNYHKMTAHKFHVYYKDFKKLKKDKLKPSKIFIGKHDKNEYRAEEQQIAWNKFPFVYYTDSTFPAPILLACNGDRNAIVLYNYQNQPLTDAEISCMFFASKICRVGVRVPIIVGKFDPVLTLFDLFDIRFLIERVELDFVGLNVAQLNELPKEDRAFYVEHAGLYYPDTRYRLDCYKRLHEVLARYKMQLFLYAETPKQAKKIKSKGLKIANK